MANGGHNKEALALDALGALDESELSALSAHLEACPECRSEREEMLAAAASLAHTVPPVAPPEELRARILAGARALKLSDKNGYAAEGARVITPPPERFARPARRRNAWVVYGAIAAGVILALLSFDIFKMWRENGEMREEMARLAQSVEAAREELAREREEAARQREVADLLSEPRARMLTLSASKDAPPEASARLAYDDSTGRAMLFASGLPPAPAGKAYQIWYIAGGRPVPGSVFKTDSRGRGMLRDEIPAAGREAKVFAVTLEPEAGVPAPTGSVLLSAAS